MHSIRTKLTALTITSLLVSLLCEKMLERGRMPLYRYEVGNEASERISEKLGFVKAACLEGAQVFYEEEDTK